MTESLSIVTEAPSDTIAITVNGAERRIPASWTLSDLLDSLGLDARTIVIEHNATILRDRGAFASLELQPADNIEIVHFVGGG